MKKPTTGTQALIDRLDTWMQRLIAAGPSGLAVLLSEVIVQLKGKDNWFVTCHECGLLYSPLRRPAKSRRNYCELCRSAGIPLRDALRDHRLKHPRRDYRVKGR
jgi:hypothetical protein